MTNRLLKGAHLSERKAKEIIHLFREDLNATQIANITHVSRITINAYLKRIRIAIAAHCELNSPFLPLTVKEPENISHFGFSRHANHIYITAVDSVDQKALELIRSETPHIQAVADCIHWKLYRLETQLHKNGSPVMDDISGFWALIKSRLQKFRGMHRNTIYLHVRECEFRYNHREEGITELLQQLLFENNS